MNQLDETKFAIILNLHIEHPPISKILLLLHRITFMYLIRLDHNLILREVQYALISQINLHQS